MIKRLLFLLSVLLVLLIAVILFRTFTMPSRQETETHQPLFPLPDSCISHLQQAIRFQTVSFDDSSRRNTAELIRFQQFLEKAFPLVHQKLRLQKINRYTLLYTWKGRDPRLNPVVFMAHQDVVPVEEASRQQWKFPPFAGVVKGGFIWGRGAFDDKISLVSILESAERLLKEGFTPARNIYFVFGHDEEASGGKGAAAVAALFEKQGIRPAYVLDEGGIITRTKVPGMKKPVALIGTAEKGYVSAELSVNIPGGHSSMPEKETAIDVLSQAVVRLRNHPFKPYFSQATLDFMKYLGPEMPFVQKMAFANLWLFKPLVIHIYSASAGGNAIIRTTTAPTIFHAGVKENVIPSEARTVINFRTLPGTHSDDVIRHIREAVNDSRIKVNVAGATNEASVVSGSDDRLYHQIAATIQSVYPGVITAPFLMIGATDSRHFTKVSPHVFRFTPAEDPEGYHGINERVRISDYRRYINFYYRLMKQEN